jgi:Type III secretion basal body protein I, YscI, HrpB, PscI
MDKLTDSLKLWSSDEPSAGSSGLSEPSAEDLSLFRQAMSESPAHADERISNVGVGAALSEIAGSLRGQTADLYQTMKNYGATANPIESLKMQRQMSKLFIEHSLAVKVISKSSQAIDSLVRLQ